MHDLNVLIPEVDFYTRILVGILGVSFPILFQLIAKLDDKYSSLRIVEIFNKELEVRWFIRFLIASIACCILWSLKLQPQIELGSAQWLLNNSADLLVLISTFGLLICFFLYVYKIRIYYIASKFVVYLFDKHKKSDNLQYFEAIGDVYHHAIKKENEKLSITIYRFLSDEYRKIRESTNDLEVKYPDMYYEVHHKAFEEIAALGNRRSPRLEHRIASNSLLMGGNGTGLTPDTFAWIWENINTALRYKRDDLIIHHWKAAHQICNLTLNRFSFQEEDNAEQKKHKLLVRERFMEFHTALGGLLLYSKRYSCLEAILSYSTSEPPSYELIPQGMYVIFPTFFKFIDPYYRNFSFISFFYSFPGAEGTKADGLIKKWIARYITLVFIRQYTLHKYYTYDNHIEFPNPPQSQFEKKFWINRLDYFKTLLMENLNDHELLSALNYRTLTDEWGKAQGVIPPLQYITDFKTILENNFAETEITQTVFPAKEKLFLDSSAEIFEETLSQIISIRNNVAIIGGSIYVFEGGVRVHNKDSFTENPEVAFMEAETYFARTISADIRNEISYTFHHSSKKRFLFRPEELFKAIDQLKLSDTHIILTFGLNVSHYSNLLKIDLNTTYKGIDIFHFNNYIGRAATVFVLPKSDLPQIDFLEIPVETIQKYNLVQTSQLLNLQASIVDLFIKPELIDENLGQFDRSQLMKSVLLCLFIKVEVKWSKTAQILQFAEYSEYLQAGMPNDLDVIGNFNDMFK